MRSMCQLVVASIIAALISGAQAGDEQLAPGMTPQEVVGIMGPPSIARLERNGVQCLVYRPSERRVTHLIFLRDVLLTVFRLAAWPQSKPFTPPTPRVVVRKSPPIGIGPVSTL